PQARWRTNGLLAAARPQLGDAAAEALAAEGARLSTHEAFGLAVRLHVPGEPAAPPALAAPIAPFAPFAPAEPQAPAAGVPDPAGPGPAAGALLTSRELQIAQLVARGLSNRGIADELIISPATAARHVANIFGKLGFTSRSQVAAWVAEHYPGRPLG
ncbi:MAG TPA: helix-turn-helix transcriptional regulator, partial [Streptosporangiaceae bacterium]